MWGLDGLGWPGFATLGGQITLPTWAVVLCATLLLLFLLIALFRVRFVRIVMALSILALACGAVWAYLDRDRIDERRSLEARLAALQAQALEAGSVLACLTMPLTDMTEAGCEKAVFSSPEDIAASLSFVSARLALLSDGLTFATKRDPEFDTRLTHLRRGLEQDRFGLVANVLVVRDGCTADRCDALLLFKDANRVRASMRDNLFQNAVARHSPGWQPRYARQQTSTAAPPASPASPPLYAPAPLPGPMTFVPTEPTGAAGQPTPPDAAASAAATPRRPPARAPVQARSPTAPLPLPSPPPRPQ